MDIYERIEDPARRRASWFVLPGVAAELDPEERRLVRAGSDIPVSAFR